VDFLFSGADSLKEKGQPKKMKPEEGREAGRGRSSPQHQVSQHLGAMVTAYQAAHALL